MLKFALHPHAFFSRNFRTSVAFEKQPPWDRQRMQRKRPPPFHRLSFYDENPIKNLKFDQLFPSHIPGRWGSTSVETKEKFYKIGQILKHHPTLYEKLQELYYHENNLWYHRVDFPLDFSNTLDFSQYITRTNLRPIKELESNKFALSSRNLSIIQNCLEEFLTSYPLKPNSDANERQEFLGSFMECIYSTLIEHFDKSHLLTRATHLCVGAKIETFFKRFGFADLFDSERIKKECLSEGVWETTEEAILDAQKLLRFRICGKLAWQIRADSPLPPFVTASESVCFEDKLPRDGSLYRPEVFGLDPIDHYDFSCLPFIDNINSPEYIRSVAGYWPPSPFLPDPVSEEPCKFGLLGVLDVTPSSEQMHLHCNNIAAASDSIVHDAISNGLLAAFAWTSSMAYSQGFTLYNELERPFSVQLLLFDSISATWQLIAYQLNSLCSLWKAADAGDPFNLLWHSPRLPMFHSPSSTDLISSQGNRLNLEVLELVARAMLLPPTPVEEKAQVRLIPNSHNDAGDQAMTTINGAEAQLTQAEREALAAMESDEIARRGHPIRAFSHPSPHPNEVFFLKLTEKAELLKEIQEKMPAFGGDQNFSYECGTEVPESSKEALRRFRLHRRSRSVNNKVLRLPPRWR